MAERELIGILTVAFRARSFIEAWVRQFQVSTHADLLPLAVCSVKGWHSEWKQDDTPALAHEAGALVLEGEWADDAMQRNAGLEFLRAQGCEWALIVDTDEFYTSSDVTALLHSLRGPYNAVRAPMMDVYWKTACHKITPVQNDNPIVAIKTDKKFTFSRLSAGLMSMQSHARLHHMSYVRSDEEMLAKIQSYEHHFEVRSDWYQQVWLKWTPEMQNLHPVVPAQFERADWNAPPDEILELVG